MGLVVVVSSFFKALGQIGDPRFRKVLFLGIGLTFALLVAAYAGLLWVFELVGAEEFLADTLGEVTWIGQLLSGASFLLMIVLSIFLMVPVASAITSMFLDEVAQAVEDRHYPDLQPASNVPFGDAVRDTLAFLGILIVANILAFIVYAMFPPFSMFIFWALNGFLLGREYFQLAAMRRVGRQGAKELRRRHAGTIWLAGTLMAVPLSVPLVNLLIPIMGAATFTHLYHQLSRSQGT